MAPAAMSKSYYHTCTYIPPYLPSHHTQTSVHTCCNDWDHLSGWDIYIRCYLSYEPTWSSRNRTQNNYVHSFPIQGSSLYYHHEVTELWTGHHSQWYCHTCHITGLQNGRNFRRRKETRWTSKWTMMETSGRWHVPHPPQCDMYVPVYM